MGFSIKIPLTSQLIKKHTNEKNTFTFYPIN